MAVVESHFRSPDGFAGRTTRHGRELEIQLQDSILRPVVTDMRGVLGMADPPSLQNLPAELAENILQRLEVSKETVQ